MRIVVLVKVVPDPAGPRRLDPATGWLDRSDGGVVDVVDERALELALRLTDARADTEVVALAMGPAEIDGALRRILVRGVDRVVHVRDDALAGADALLTAHALAAALRRERADLVIAGTASTDGGGGVVPAMIAELLDLPMLGSVDGVEIGDGAARATRVTPAYTAVLSAPLPALVSITERVPLASPPAPARAGGDPRRVDVLDAAGLGVDLAARTGSRVLSVERAPVRDVASDDADAARPALGARLEGEAVALVFVETKPGGALAATAGELVSAASAIGTPLPVSVEGGPSARAAALAAAARSYEASAVVLAHSASGREAAGRLAARLGAAVVLDVVGLERTEGRIVATHSVLGGAYVTTSTGPAPLVVTVREGAFDAAPVSGLRALPTPADARADATVESLTPAAAREAQRT
ncbi:hypothetical protein ACIQLJ_01305 [Microbacterium sp. NPDC091313]